MLECALVLTIINETNYFYKLKMRIAIKPMVYSFNERL